jgi:hypothetical protein
MSAKWIRAQQWERQHLTGVWTPVRWVLHTFSTVKLAVVLLTLMTLFGVLASVPIGMLALAPTMIVYGLTILASMGVLMVVPTWLLWRGMRSAGVSFGWRFAVAVPMVIALTVVSVLLWNAHAWPLLKYDPIDGGGLRFFAAFCEQYKGTTVRRLPGMEMSELEFYAWWPMELLLILFVVNMVVTTVRRIEFSFVNIGVLTVHTGIVVLALGSVYYAAFKQEGDVLLRAGPIERATGVPTVGPEEIGFFDNTRTVLRVRQVRTANEKIQKRIPPDLEWEQRPLGQIPRYNHYNLGAVESTRTPRGMDLGDGGRRLSIHVPGLPTPEEHAPLVDTDITFRVVGYASYAELTEAWKASTAPSGAAIQNPVRFVEILSGLPAEGQAPVANGEMRPVDAFGLAPRLPTERVASLGEAIVVEVFEGLPTARWEELKAPLPEGASHGLIVEIPGKNGAPPVSRVYAIREGQTLQVGAGMVGGPVDAASGYSVTVTTLAQEPPLPIVTPGYRGASSSVAILRVRTPSGEVFDRYCYARLPELNQDIVVQEAGSSAPLAEPKRRAISGDIRLTYIDASRVKVYFDETGRTDAQGRPIVRGMVRIPGRSAVERAQLVEGDRIDLGPMAAVRLGSRLAHAERIGVPRIVPETEQDRDNIGNHRRAMLAVEVRVMDRPDLPTDSDADVKWKTTVWLPFRQYYGLEQEEGAMVRLPDGRVVEMVFGRLWRQLPGMSLALKQFEMLPYPHSQQPRDFRSDLIVRKFGPRDERGQPTIVEEERYTSLNDPLLESPFTWHEDNGLLRNIAGWLGTRLGPAQYKFSQNGWDPTGWNETQARVASGELPRPSARFTILGVGNNPGIYIIALGAILMSVGVPWAFYIKPWLVRRKKAKIQAELAASGKLPSRDGQARASDRNGEKNNAAAGARSMTETHP